MALEINKLYLCCDKEDYIFIYKVLKKIKNGYKCYFIVQHDNENDDDDDDIIYKSSFLYNNSIEINSKILERQSFSLLFEIVGGI